jgi:Na+/H+-dicarboxylate symporter
VFAVFVGVALVTMESKLARPLVDLLGAVQEVSMVVVRWAMYLVPAAVFGLMTQLTARMGLDALLGMGVYVLTVLGALLLAFAFLMLVYALGRRRSPLTFLRGSRDVLLLAFSTSSSAAVMPLTIRTAESALGVKQGVARFVIPLGTTINMAGTALYQVIATLFLAQVYQVDVGLSGLLLVVAAGVLPPGRGQDLHDSLEFISTVRIRNQADDLTAGLEPGNSIEPDKLSAFERKSLRDAFSILGDAQSYLKFRYQPGRST